MIRKLNMRGIRSVLEQRHRPGIRGTQWEFLLWDKHAHTKHITQILPKTNADPKDILCYLKLKEGPKFPLTEANYREYQLYEFLF